MEGEVAGFVAAGGEAGRAVEGCRVGSGGVVGHHGDSFFPCFAAASVDYAAAHHKGVYGGTGGEDIFETWQEVAFIEVGNGLLELEEVCGIGQEGVVQFHEHAFAFGGVFGLVFQGGRDQDVVGCVLEHDVFVELDVELVAVEVEAAVDGACTEGYGRGLVLGSAGRVALFGTGGGKHYEETGDCSQ